MVQKSYNIKLCFLNAILSFLEKDKNNQRKKYKKLSNTDVLQNREF